MTTILKSLIVASFLASAFAFACPGDKHGVKQCDHKEGQCPYHKQKSWSEKLGLSGDKAQQVDAMQEQFMQEKKDLKEAHHTAMKNLKSDHKSALAQVLTEEQIAEIQPSHHHRKHDHSDKAFRGDKPHKQCPHKDKEKTETQ